MDKLLLSNDEFCKEEMWPSGVILAFALCFCLFFKTYLTTQYDSIAQFFQPASRNFTAKAEYISKFDENLECLKNSLTELEEKKIRVLRKVDVEELKGRQRKDEVRKWLSDVQDVETSSLVADASALPRKCCSDIISTYRYGKKIFKMLIEVKRLLSSGNFDVVASPARPPFVVEEPVQQTFGLDDKLDSIWKLLMDAGTRMLSLYGMGGVGKTTLLHLIEEKFAQVEDKFDVVIWVEVCKDALGKDTDIGKIQDDIGKRLGLYDDYWCQKSQRERAIDIRRVLKDAKHHRFVLLLDNLWEDVSLNKIGIPLQGREYKVVFTTRFMDVCRIMGANQDIEVQCLTENYAWDLFKLKSRCSGLSGEICTTAKEIAGNCCGLPLALEVIGKSLASITDADEWRRARDALNCCPSELKGTEKGIFQVLKLSYDHLEKIDTKLCFQYCALFPKAYYIKQDELVEYWIGEGIIDEIHGRQKAKDRGYDIIKTLVEASLLLKDGHAKQKVYMHDMIREMALEIVSQSRDGERFVVKADVGLSQLPDVTDWTKVTKISLMKNKIESIQDSPRLPNPDCLKTLFLQKNKLVDIVGRFFLVMSTLVVLDLSCNLGITNLPEEIALLVRLRYLNLLKTSIKSLPKDFKKLIGLIHLDLETTTELQDISPISGLPQLQVLRFYRSAPLDHSFLESLEHMKKLKILTVTVKKDIEVLKDFLGSKMAGLTEGLYLDELDVSGKSFAATFGELDSLSKLGMSECNIIESETELDQYFPSTSSNTWFKNLSDVVLSTCINLKDVTWLIYAANLKSLSIKNSPKMEEVISKEKAGDVVDEPFRKLQVLELEFMNEVKSIYWSPLSFPNMQKLQITCCPQLRKLPLSNEIIDALHIKLDDGWWVQGGKWERVATKCSIPVESTASVSEIHSVT